MEELETIDISKKCGNLGKLKYKQMPHLEDWIEIKVDGTFFMFEVVKIVHSSTGAGGDIYVKRLKESVPALTDLLQPS